MHNALTRIQNVFGFFTTVASFVAGAIALVSFLTTTTPNLKDGALQLQNVQVTMGRPHYYSRQKEEYAHIVFDLDLDLQELYTWNTKQVFLYVTATYPPTDKPSSTLAGEAPDSTAVIWDAVLPHPQAPDHHNQYTYPAQRKAAARDKSKTRSKSSSKSKASSAAKSSSKPAAKDAEVEIVPGLLKLAGQKPKYQLTSPTMKIASRSNATLALNYNIQPWVGALTWASGTLKPEQTAWWSTWQALAHARTAQFDLPPLKNETEARRAAGKEGLSTAKGEEANRGKPA